MTPRKAWQNPEVKAVTVTPIRPVDAKQRIADTTHRLLAEADAGSAAHRHELIDKVVMLNAPVARSIASRYRSKGVDPDDLEQVAYLGLVKAAHGYRPTTDTAFLAYAVPTIRGELKRYFRDYAWTVRPPRRVQELQGSIAAAEHLLTQRLGRAPSAEETAAQLGAKPADVAEATAVRGCFNTLSLDAPVTTADGSSLMDTVADAEDGYAQVDTVHTLAPVVSGLAARERRILELRFGGDLTQDEIGVELGISQMQVSRLLRGILDRLRADLTRTVAEQRGA